MPPTLLVLLVDRDADTRLMYAEYLRQFEFEIDEAEAGPEALAKAIARRPNVIVTETRLAGISGFDLCRLLRIDVSTRAIPILIVTADVLAAHEEDAEAADAVLIKPCLPEVLVSEIRRVLPAVTATSRTGSIDRRRDKPAASGTTRSRAN
jgi:CheY-like chemotaxis protein